MNTSLIKSIKIGPYNFDVQARSRAWYNTHGVFGNMVADDLVINVCTFGRAIVVLDTLVHELHHAIWYVYHLNEKVDDEERIVSVTATAWTALLRDNPDFVEFQDKVVGDYHASQKGKGIESPGREEGANGEEG